MFQVVYVSQHRLDVDANGYSPEFSAIANAARLKNEQLAITGFLICASGWFCQVLEGPQRSVIDVLAAIVRDPRHSNLTVFSSRLTDERQYPQWGMQALVLAPQMIACQLILLERRFSRRMAPLERSANELLELCSALYRERDRALVLA